MFFTILLFGALVTLVTAESECPSGYKAYKKEACFKLVYNEQFTILQQNAARACTDSFGILASFDNAQQLTWIFENLWNDTARHALWIGYRRNIRNPYQFEWMDNSSSKYTNWRYGEPNNRHEECVHMGRGGWNDIPCSAKEYGFVCRAVYLERKNNNLKNDTEKMFDLIEEKVHSPPMFVHKMNPPVIYFAAENLTKTKGFSENQNIRNFYCRATGNPRLSYRWLKNGQPFNLADDQLAQRITQVPNEGTFVFNGVTMEDEGIYSCIAENLYGSAYDRPIKFKRAFLNNFSNGNIEIIDINIGNQFSRQCQPPDSIPPAKTHWILKTGPEVAAFNIKKINASNIVVNDKGTIFFQHVIDSDNSSEFYFTCVAENVVLREFRYGNQFAFNVINSSLVNKSRQAMETIGPLEQYTSPGQMTVVAGGTLELFCVFSGGFNFTPSWTKHDGRLDVSRISYGTNFQKSIKIDNITENDAGIYECLIDANTNKTFKVIVESAPYWVGEIQQIINESERIIQIHCNVEANPDPTITFYKNGQKVVYDSRIVQRGKYLVISDYRKGVNGSGDDAVYQCSAENEHGSVWTNFYPNI